jgi:hypothetical protein
MIDDKLRDTDNGKGKEPIADVKAKKLAKAAIKDIDRKSDDDFRLVPSEPQGITAEKLKKFLPKGVATQVTEEILQKIREMEDSTDLPQNLLEEDLMSYMHLIGNRQGVGLNDLINAVKFCNLKRFMGIGKAWSIVFPKKANERMERGLTIDNFASMYNKTVLVVEIDKQMIMPFGLQYSAHGHKAMSILSNMMMGNSPTGGKVSPMVIYLCAKEILERTVSKETQEIELKIGKTDSAREQDDRTFNTLAQIAKQQQELISRGGNISDIQRLNLTVTEVSDDDVIEGEYE